MTGGGQDGRGGERLKEGRGRNEVGGKALMCTREGGEKERQKD